jgi:hypothetical protein
MITMLHQIKNPVYVKYGNGYKLNTAKRTITIWTNKVAAVLAAGFVTQNHYFPNETELAIVYSQDDYQTTLDLYKTHLRLEVNQRIDKEIIDRKIIQAQLKAYSILKKNWNFVEILVAALLVEKTLCWERLNTILTNQTHISIL